MRLSGAPARARAGTAGLRTGAGASGRRSDSNPGLPLAPSSAPVLADGPRASAPEPAPRGQVPRLTRILALAHHFAELIRTGVLADYAEVARLTGFTRARITQMMGLTLLAPDIQEQILTWPRVKGERSAPSEKRVRRIAAVAGWEEQRRVWHNLTY